MKLNVSRVGLVKLLLYGISTAISIKLITGIPSWLVLGIDAVGSSL